MSRGMVSFLAGLGSGYLKAKDSEYERSRQAKEDAWREEQRGRQRTEWQKADNLDSDLRAAANPVSQGAVITDDAGSNAFTKDKDAAAMMADMSNAKNTGMEVQQATRVVDQTYTDPAKAGEAAKTATAPDARNARVADTLMKHGQIERATTMESTALDQKAKRLGLEVAELKFADDQFNRQLGQTFAETPDWTQAAAQVLTKTQVGGLAGVTVQAVPSQDGKKVDFVGQGQDGKQKALATFDNNDAGKAQFLQRVMRAPVETKLGWLMEEAKGKQAQDNADREHGIRLAELEIKAREAQSREELRQVQAEIAQLRASRAGSGGGGGGGGYGGSGVNFDPYEGFDPKNAQAEATRTVDEILVNSGKQVNAADRARLISEQVFALRDSYAGQNANRHRASAFIGSARSAQTPQEIEAVRQQALSQGFTNQQMAGLDPRFAVAAPKTSSAPTQASTPMTSLLGRPETPAYTPPPGSPSAKAAENRARVQADNQARRDASIKAVRSAASAAIASGDIAAGAKVQDMPAFRLLPDAEKLAIRKLVFGR